MSRILTVDCRLSTIRVLCRAVRPETTAIHAGRAGRVAGEPLNPPLVPASNFYESGYAREQGSPGWGPFEAAIGTLEGGTAVAFGSGMAAISAVLETLPPGAKVVGPAAGYAWTRRRPPRAPPWST
jgi:cystathionine gamma-synthase